MMYPYKHERVLRIRDERNDYSVIGALPHSTNKKRRAVYCKKLKGEHDYMLDKTVEWQYLDGGWHEYKCTACNKLKHISF